jgi:predicted amino acid racemase
MIYGLAGESEVSRESSREVNHQVLEAMVVCVPLTVKFLLRHRWNGGLVLLRQTDEALESVLKAAGVVVVGIGVAFDCLGGE